MDKSTILGTQVLQSEGPMKKRNGAEPHGNVQEVSLQLLYINIEDHMHNNFVYHAIA